jgi:platelet-activating factor acetylhydrolase
MLFSSYDGFVGDDVVNSLTYYERFIFNLAFQLYWLGVKCPGWMQATLIIITIGLMTWYWKRTAVAFGAILLLVVGMWMFGRFSPYVMPYALRGAMEPLPEPRGAYHVGTSLMEAPIDGQMLNVRVFYPSMDALPSKSERPAWLPRDYGEEIGRSKGWSAEWTEYLLAPLYSMRIQARAEGKPIKKELPLAIFTHGLSGTAFVYSSILIELASRGYFVAAIEHGEGSASLTITSTHNISYGDTDLAREYKARYTKENDIGHLVQKRRLDEIRAVQKKLRALNGGGIFEGRLPSESFDQSVIIGHSFGGGTAVAACSKSAGVSLGFKRAILLDPWLDPLAPEQMMPTVPTLVVNSANMMYTRNLVNIVKLLSYAADNIAPRASSKSSQGGLRKDGKGGKQDSNLQHDIDLQHDSDLHTLSQVGGSRHTTKSNRSNSSSSSGNSGDQSRSFFFGIPNTRHQDQSDMNFVAAPFNRYIFAAGPMNPRRAWEINSDLIIGFLGAEQPYITDKEGLSLAPGLSAKHVSAIEIFQKIRNQGGSRCGCASDQSPQRELGDPQPNPSRLSGHRNQLRQPSTHLSWGGEVQQHDWEHPERTVSLREVAVKMGKQLEEEPSSCACIPHADDRHGLRRLGATAGGGQRGQVH